MRLPDHLVDEAVMVRAEVHQASGEAYRVLRHLDEEGDYNDLEALEEALERIEEEKCDLDHAEWRLRDFIARARASIPRPSPDTKENDAQ